MSSNTRLVYSTDPKENKRCPKCKNLIRECRCKAEVKVTDPSKITAVLRIEKSGRGGKTVTVIDRLPKSESYLKGLTKDLKSKCGSGGTYSAEGEHGNIEIQGDKRDQLRQILTKLKMTVKG